MKPQMQGADAFAGSPQWTNRFHTLCQRLHDARHRNRREKVRTELWLLLNSLFCNYLNRHSRRYGNVVAEDIQDLIAELSFSIFTRLESGRLDLGGRNDQQLVSYFSTAAHQGLLQFFRRAGRSTVPVEELELPTRGAEHADSGVESREFADDLQVCASKLKDRARAIWFFRVFYGLSSREIAVHPEICLNASHVDVVLHRVRSNVRDCMRASGHELSVIPPGTMIRLWRAFRMNMEPSEL